MWRIGWTDLNRIEVEEKWMVVGWFDSGRLVYRFQKAREIG